MCLRATRRQQDHRKRLSRLDTPFQVFCPDLCPSEARNNSSMAGELWKSAARDTRVGALGQKETASTCRLCKAERMELTLTGMGRRKIH